LPNDSGEAVSLLTELREPSGNGTHSSPIVEISDPAVFGENPFGERQNDDVQP
jgi:hypothetical protein